MSLLALWSLRSLVVILIGAFVTLCLRRRSAAVRSLSLRATLLAAWLLPFAALIAPRIEVTLPKAPVPVQEAPAVPAPLPVAELSTVAPEPFPPVGAITATPTSVPTPPRPEPIDPSAFLPYVYFLGVIAMTMRWVAGLIRLRLIARRGEAIAPGMIRVNEIGVPATFGLLRPAVLLPAESAAWPEARLRAAVLHEEAHIRRRDWLWQTLANLFTTLHWFNPASWLLARALRDTAEAATDDEVLANGFAATAYARELLAVAATASSAGPALAMARRGGVSDRVAAILIANRDRRRPTRLASAALIFSLVGIGLLIAGVAEAQARGKQPDEFTKTLKNGVEVSVAKIRDYGVLPRRAWLPDGTLLPEKIVSDDFSDFMSEDRSKRKVSMELRIVSPAGGERPAVIMLEPTDNPLSQENILPGEQRTQLVWAVPLKEIQQKVRIGIAAGAWIPYTGPMVSYKLGVAKVKRSQGHYPGTTVAFGVPRAMAGRQIRVQGLDAKGKVVASQPVSMRAAVPEQPYGSTMVVYLRADRKNVASVKFAYRDYEEVTFPAVTVKPQSSPGARSLQLVGIGYPGGKAWKINGTPDANLKPPTVVETTRPGWRRISVALRVEGSADESPVRVTVWDKYAYPSDGYRYQTVGDERIVWCSILLRPNVNVSRLGVDSYPGVWETHADVDPARSPEVKITEGDLVRLSNNRIQQYDLSFPGVELPGADRLTELSIHAAKGRGATYMNVRPFAGGKSYRVSVAPGDRITRVTLRSQPVQHTSYDDVHLTPGQVVFADGRGDLHLTPTRSPVQAVLADGRTVEVVRVDRLQNGALKQRVLGQEPIELMTLSDLSANTFLTNWFGAYLKINGVRRGAPALFFKASYSYGVSSKRSIGYPKGYEVWHAMFQPPLPNVKEATLSVGVAFGPWVSLKKNATYKSKKVASGGTLIETEPLGGPNDQIRFLARDRNGKLLSSWREENTMVREGKTTIFAYSKAQTTKKVASIEIQSRTIHWTALPSISTNP